MLASGALLLVVLAPQLFAVDPLLEAIHRREAFGPFDFLQRAGAPRKPLAAVQHKAACISAGLRARDLGRVARARRVEIAKPRA